MSIRSRVNDFLDKTVDARFKRDGHGHLVFFPLGFGEGRIVPDAVTETRLRTACRRLMIAIFVVLVPGVSMINAFFELSGVSFLIFFAACVALGFGTQLYPLWLSRDLQRSGERQSYTGSAFRSLERFGSGFLVFGLATSLLFVAIAVTMLALGSATGAAAVGTRADPTAMVVSLLVFAPLAIIYAIALWRRRRNGGTAG